MVRGSRGPKGEAVVRELREGNSHRSIGHSCERIQERENQGSAEKGLVSWNVGGGNQLILIRLLSF